jgi:16S rRNA (cytosine967-C5)-methyltransferase
VHVLSSDISQRDEARAAAWHALLNVNAEGAYANIAIEQVLRKANLEQGGAGFCTELFFGTCRWQGSLDVVLEAASGRALSTLQPAVVNWLRLCTYEALFMHTSDHALVSSAVESSKRLISPRVSGLVNAILRKVTHRSWDEWCCSLTLPTDTLESRLALCHAHPEWIIAEFARALGEDRAGELVPLLEADNTPARPVYAVRPGLISRDDIPNARPTQYSPWGFTVPGNPATLEPLRRGVVGVQDEGSQLIIDVATRADIPEGPWLDLCAGPGGKSGLLAGIAAQRGTTLLSSEVQPHRAKLVSQALRAYPPDAYTVICADATQPTWPSNSFALVLADVPCSGLGALRRRPESRWRTNPDGISELLELQTAIAASAAGSLKPGGILAYATCTPSVRETGDIVLALAASTDLEILDAPALLPNVPDATAASDPRFIQLWPHRHNTDAMFVSLLRRAS